MCISRVGEKGSNFANSTQIDNELFKKYCPHLKSVHMSNDIKQQKEELLIKLLKENPQCSMKEANATIREAFDTGVSPPVFSRVKKQLFAGENVEVEEKAPKKIKKKAPPKVKKESKVATEVVAEQAVAEKQAPSSPEDSSDLSDNLFDGSEAKKTQIEDELKTKDVKKEPLLGDDESQAEKSEAKPSKSKPKGKGRRPKSESSEEPKAEKASAGDKKEAEEEKVAEPEIDPNLPKHRVQLSIDVPEAESVHLAGSFNAWKTAELPLAKGEGSTWNFDGELPEGEYFYKFVLDQKIWFLDMEKERFADKTGISHKIVIAAS